MSQTTQRLREVALSTPSEAANTFQAPAVFDADAWHAMQARDDQLIQDSILHGTSRREYVYEFNIQNTVVRGVSVVGARELASQYGGIKHRIVASVDKSGELFVFKSFEPLAIQANIIPQLAEQEDFYEVVIEIQDLKTGNSIQVRKKETKVERKRNGDTYTRPHFDVIAESKAYRNGVLSILPQAVIKQFMEKCLKSGNSSDEKTIDQLREGALAFAAKYAITLDRRSLEQLTYAQIFGLGNSVKDGIDAFKGAALSLGLVSGQDRATLPPADANGTGKLDPRKDASKDTADDAALKQGMERKPEQQQQTTQADDGAPTLEDAIALIKKGDDDSLALARDIGKALGKLDLVNDMIENRKPAPAAEEGQQQERPRGRRT